MSTGTIASGPAEKRSTMSPTSILLAEGARLVPATIPRTAFCRARSVQSEAEYKRRCRDSRTITYHMHLGLESWPATREALHSVASSLATSGYSVDRYGLCLDRGMSLPENDRAMARKETGPRLTGQEWNEIGQAEAIQPHLGDFMIGTPAGLENTTHALRAGVTTIGNLGQYFAFETPGGSDEIAMTETTVRALGAMAAARGRGTLVHSYLDDGPAMQMPHYGAYLGWAALELHIVEDLIGARLAHCFGGLVPGVKARVALSFALDDLRGRDSIGSMIYGNTVDYTADSVHNQAVLATYLLVDIATQLHRPTGHAINPVPLSEAERIPNASEIVDVHRMARELEHEARHSSDLFDWHRLERLGMELAEYGKQFASRALALLRDHGVDIEDAGQLLLALRQIDPVDLSERVALPVPPAIASMEPWKASRIRAYTDMVVTQSPALNGTRVVLAVLEVHDLIRDALAIALPRRGCEVILLPSDATPEQIARAAVDEDADAVVVGTYNGCALSLGMDLKTALEQEGYDGNVFFGGRLNQDAGGCLPKDVRRELRQLGIHCVERVEEIGPLLASGSGTREIERDR